MVPITDSTLLVPALFIPELPADKCAAQEVWSRVYWEARRCADVLSRNLDIQMPTHFNPEYFLGAWTDTILDRELFRQDVLGWAMYALELEQEHAMGHPPSYDDMQKESQVGYFLDRFKTWVEARLTYHRIALRLTFYKADLLASKEPIASDADRLKARLTDWRNAQLLEQRQRFETDPKIGPWLQSLQDVEHFRKEEVRALEFKQWLHRNGLKIKLITGEAVEWLCWLHLISPISREWQLHELGLAVLKTFGGRDYAAAAEKWHAKPPARQTFEEPEKTDGFEEAVIKRVFSQEFQEWRADWLAKLLEKNPRFSDTLRKQLREVGFVYRETRGRPRLKKDDLIPQAWDKREERTVDEAWMEFAKLVYRKDLPSDEFAPAGAPDDFERDEPKGWLQANNISP